MSIAQVSAKEAEAAPAGEVERRPRGGGPRRRGGAVAVVVVLAVTGAGIAIADPFDARKPDTTIGNTASTGVAKVTRGTLSARTQENGTLGYKGEYDVINKAKGTATKLPAVGDVIREGEELYRVDGKPVVLLQGAEPAYRELSRGAEGPDVRQLNAALVALGHATEDEIDPGSDHFGWETYDALQELQDERGLAETGELPLGQVVFMPVEELRITKVDAVRGGSAAPERAVMQGSSTDRQVTVELNASQQSDVAVGDKVTITLPNGGTTEGEVSTVGKVATQEKDKTTIDVKITPSDPKATGRLDQAPVQVAIVTDTVEDVLSVPVDSLLALSGGGYAVEAVRTGRANRLIPVETGLFDDSAGRVEVTGEGLKAGQKIVVPGS